MFYFTDTFPYTKSKGLMSHVFVGKKILYYASVYS